MITEINISTRVHLDHEEIWMAMLSIWGLSEKQMEEVTGIGEDRVTKIRTKLRSKLGGFNSQNMAYHAQLAGFELNGTLKGNDIFSDDMKRKILLIEPVIEFAFPIGKNI